MPAPGTRSPRDTEFGGRSAGSPAIVRLPWRNVTGEVLYPSKRSLGPGDGGAASAPSRGALGAADGTPAVSQRPQQTGRQGDRRRHPAANGWVRAQRQERIEQIRHMHRPIVTPHTPAGLLIDPDDRNGDRTGGKFVRRSQRSPAMNADAVRRIWSPRGTYQHYQLSDLIEYIGEDDVLSSIRAHIPARRSLVDPPPRGEVGDGRRAMRDANCAAVLESPQSHHEPAGSSDFVPHIRGTYHTDVSTQSVLAQSRRHLMRVHPHYRHIAAEASPTAGEFELMQTNDWLSEYYRIRSRFLTPNRDQPLYI